MVAARVPEKQHRYCTDPHEVGLGQARKLGRKKPGLTASKLTHIRTGRVPTLLNADIPWIFYRR